MDTLFHVIFVSTSARTAIYPQRCRVSSKPRMISYHSDFKSVSNRLDRNYRNIKRDKAERKGENREQGQTKQVTLLRRVSIQRG